MVVYSSDGGVLLMACSASDGDVALLSHRHCCQSDRAPQTAIRRHKRWLRTWHGQLASGMAAHLASRMAALMAKPMAALLAKRMAVVNARQSSSSPVVHLQSIYQSVSRAQRWNEVFRLKYFYLTKTKTKSNGGGQGGSMVYSLWSITFAWVTCFYLRY